GYAIPPDNPYLNDSAYLPEIWILGMRNPYGISFDSQGRLFVADAGQNLWEEVDLVEKGGNYGWNIREGTHCFDPESPNDSPASCPEVGAKGETLINPIIEYDHDNHTVVVGGYLYEGQDLTDLVGSYLFADWSSNFDQGDGRLYLARPEASDEGLWNAEEISIAGRPDGRIGEFIRAFGRDGEGEIYILTSEVLGPSEDSGKIYKLVRAEKQMPA
ncbi:PQQ-dependent sugar dehydrogenase, partial [Methanothrix sp.]